jgi:hypothetical protein
MHGDATFEVEYLQCAGVVRGLLASDPVARDWDAQSALAMWTVSGLAGHLARSVLTVPWVLSTEVSTDVPIVSAVEYFTVMSDDDNDPSSELAAMVRQRGDEAAGQGPQELLRRFDEVLDSLPDVLRKAGPAREVMAFGRRMRLDQYLVTRIVELTVHADDLSVSVGMPSPVFPEPAYDASLATLAAIAARRRGAHAVMRALARSERAPANVSAF